MFNKNSKSDWIQIIRPQRFFTLVCENKQYGFLTIKCPIDRFPEAVVHALGFSDINPGKIRRRNKMQNHYVPNNNENEEN